MACTNNAIFWTTLENPTAGPPYFVPESWMSQYISSVDVRGTVDTGIVIKMRLNPIDLKIENVVHLHNNAFYVCMANCLFESVDDVFEFWAYETNNFLK